MSRLSDRVVVITGAGQGIGKVYAFGLAAHGAKIVATDLSDPISVAKEIEALGREAISCAADVTSSNDVANVFAAAVQRFGTVHALVNNAAMFTTLKRRPFYEIESDEWDRVMQVNTRGSFECAKAATPIMRKQQYGKIINVASGTLFKGSTGLMHYVASKGAVVAMTRVMARELGDFNICVNAIAPGFTESEMAMDMAKGSAPTVASRCFKRAQTPDDLTGTLVYLCSADSDFVTGQTIVVDGGSVMH